MAKEIGLTESGLSVQGGYGTQNLPAGIVLADVETLPEQGYILNWSEKPVVWGRDYAGFYYGCVTLAQVMRQIREAGIDRIPAFRIVDYPDLRRRGVLVDFGRGLSFNMEWVQRFILRMASFKVNEFYFYYEDRLEMKSLPLFAAEHSATQVQIRELIRWRHGHAVTIVPAPEMLAHNEGLLRQQRYAHLREERNIEDAMTLCPSHPETREMLRSQVAELCQLFDSPFALVSMDEVELGPCPRCAERAKTIGTRGIYVDHAKFLRDEVAAGGKRMAFWADALNEGGKYQQRKDPVLNELKGAIVFHWCYDGSRPDGLRFFKQQDCDVYTCATTVGWQQLFDDYEDSMHKSLALLRDTHEVGVLGSVTCIWEVLYGQRADYMLPSVCHYAAAMWDRRPVPSQVFLEYFGNTCVGTDGRRFAAFILDLSKTTARDLTTVAEQKAWTNCSRGWRYEIYAASDPLYTWKRLKRQPGLVERVAAFCETQGQRLEGECKELQNAATRGPDFLAEFETIFLCLRTAAVRLHAGQRLQKAYEQMDRAAVSQRAPYLKEALAAIDEIGRDLTGHENSERRFIGRTGGDYHALECMADVRRRLAQWKDDIRAAADKPRMPALDLLLSLRNYRDPYPTTIRRFDTNKTLDERSESALSQE